MPKDQPPVPEEVFESEPQPTQDNPGVLAEQELSAKDAQAHADEAKQPEQQPQEIQRDDRHRSAPPPLIDAESIEGGGTIHLATLVSDEFGVSRIVAEQEILMGKILLDDEEYHLSGDNLHVPVSQLVGKRLTIKGRDRSFVITYRDERINEG